MGSGFHPAAGPADVSARPALRPGRPAVLILCRECADGQHSFAFTCHCCGCACCLVVPGWGVISLQHRLATRCQAVCLRVVANNDNSNRVITCKKMQSNAKPVKNGQITSRKRLVITEKTI